MLGIYNAKKWHAWKVEQLSYNVCSTVGEKLYLNEWGNCSEMIALYKYNDCMWFKHSFGKKIILDQ